jgi:hypothetical protein
MPKYTIAGLKNTSGGGAGQKIRIAALTSFNGDALKSYRVFIGKAETPWGLSKELWDLLRINFFSTEVLG